MKLRICMIAFTVVLFAAVACQAGNVVVIVNAGNALSNATASEVGKVFMGKSSAIGGISVDPVDQGADSQARADFSDKILGRTVKKVTDYWKKRVFSGKGEPPKELANDARVKAYVASTPGAIGYISASSLDGSVKALSVDGKVEW